MELKLFNSLYTQTSYYNKNGQQSEKGHDYRATFFASNFRASYGLNHWATIGLSVSAGSMLLDTQSKNATKVFAFKNDGFSHRTAIGYISPQLTFLLKNNKEKGLNTAWKTIIRIPVANDLDGSQGGKGYYGFDGYTISNYFLLDKKFGQNFTLYMQSGLVGSIPKNQLQQGQLYSPVELIFSYFPKHNYGIYINKEWIFGSNGKFIYSGKFGGGAKFLLSHNFEIELAYTNYYTGLNQGAGENVGLGLRLLH